MNLLILDCDNQDNEQGNKQDNEQGNKQDNEQSASNREQWRDL